jgi:hypothetical protein
MLSKWSFATWSDKLQTKSATRTGKSESVTFRFNSEIMKDLRHEAEQKEININTLVNQIVKEHLNWHSNASKAGFIAVRRSFIINLISYLSDQDIISVAENVAKTTNKESILLLEKEYTMKSALDFIESWIKISGYTYRHEETNDDSQNRHIYVIKHDMGIKMSIYLANLYQFLFDELRKNKRRIEFDKTENTLAFTVDID